MFGLLFIIGNIGNRLFSGVIVYGCCWEHFLASVSEIKSNLVMFGLLFIMRGIFRFLAWIILGSWFGCWVVSILVWISVAKCGLDMIWTSNGRGILVIYGGGGSKNLSVNFGCYFPEVPRSLLEQFCCCAGALVESLGDGGIFGVFWLICWLTKRYIKETKDGWSSFSGLELFCKWLLWQVWYS